MYLDRKLQWKTFKEIGSIHGVIFYKYKKNVQNSYIKILKSMVVKLVFLHDKPLVVQMP